MERLGHVRPEAKLVAREGYTDDRKAMTDDSKALLLLDRPLRYEEKDYDFLGRMRFAESLCRFLEGVDLRNGATVGVVGGWGVGKTTVLNFTEGLLRESGEGRFRVARFDPWLCEDPKDLAVHFLSMLALELYEAWSPPTKVLRDSVETAKRMSKRVTAKARDEAVGKVIAMAAPLMTGALNAALATIGIPPFAHALGIGEIAKEEWDRIRRKAHSPYEGLMTLKSELSEELRTADDRQSSIILVDEIDRLQRDELRQFFKVVRMVCDLPGTAFVMAMDERRVSALLEADGGVDYHDKFLQTVFRVPAPAPGVLRDAVGGVVAELSEAHRKAECDEKRLSAAKDVLVPGIIRNVRDLRRWAHALQFVVITHDDLDVIDLALMEALRIRDRDSFDRLAEDIRFGRTELFPADRSEEFVREMKHVIRRSDHGGGTSAADSQEKGSDHEAKDRGAKVEQYVRLDAGVVESLRRLVFPRLESNQYDPSLSSGRLVHESNWIEYHSQYDDRHAFIEREAERIAGLLDRPEAFVCAVEGLDGGDRRHCLERFRDKVGTHWPDQVPIESALVYAKHWRDWFGVGPEVLQGTDALIKAGEVLLTLALRSNHPESLLEALEASEDVGVLCALWIAIEKGGDSSAIGESARDRLLDWLVCACESGDLRRLGRTFRSSMLIRLGYACRSRQRIMKPVLTPEDVLGLVGTPLGDITFSWLLSDMRRGLGVTFKDYVLRIADQLLRTILHLFQVNRSEFLQLVREAGPLVGELRDPHEIKAMQAVLEAMLDPQNWPEGESGDAGDAEREA